MKSSTKRLGMSSPRAAGGSTCPSMPSPGCDVPTARALCGCGRPSCQPRRAWHGKRHSRPYGRLSSWVNGLRTCPGPIHSCGRRDSPCFPLPRRALSFLFGDAAFLVAFLDVPGLAFLLIGICRLVTAWHGVSSEEGVSFEPRNWRRILLCRRLASARTVAGDFRQPAARFQSQSVAAVRALMPATSQVNAAWPNCRVHSNMQCILQLPCLRWNQARAFRPLEPRASACGYRG